MVNTPRSSSDYTESSLEIDPFHYTIIARKSAAFAKQVEAEFQRTTAEKMASGTLATTDSSLPAA